MAHVERVKEVMYRTTEQAMLDRILKDHLVQPFMGKGV